MSRIVQRTPAARGDLIGIYVSIGQRDVGAAERFLDQAEDAIERLSHSPGTGELVRPKVARCPGLRVTRVPRFRQ